MRETTPNFKAALYIEDDHLVRYGDWWLDPQEAYLVSLLRRVKASVYWTDPIVEFAKAPTRDGFYRLMDALADQHVDNPLAVKQVLGEELAMQLPVYRLMRAWQERPPGGKLLDLRELRAGTRFRFKTDPDQPTYVVVAQQAKRVRYRNAASKTHPVQSYPKLEGLVAVHV